MTNNKSLYQNICVPAIFIAVFACSFFLDSPAKAAALYLSASSNKVNVGNSVTVNLYLSTQGKSINNAEANIKFSNDLLDVVSVKGSLFSLWVENPSFSNGSGRISFNGGIPAPGYTGNNGRVLTIVARTKKAGTASFAITGGAVRENDGLGTDILTSKSSANISIVSDTAEPKDNPATPKKTDNSVAPVVAMADNSALPPLAVSSPTYLEKGWSSSKKGTISWKVPSGASEVQTIIDHNPYSLPSITYHSPVNNKDISDLGDGVWYFHVRYLFNGQWSPVSNYKIQVDTTPPSNLSINAEKKGDSCIAGLKLASQDIVSGVDYYQIKIDDQPAIKVLAADADNIVPWPAVKAGIHKILVTVYDKAGNKAETGTTLATEKLSAPALVSLPSSIPVGEKIEISGRSAYANAPFKLAITTPKSSKTFDLVSDGFGRFTFSSGPTVDAGRYQVSAYALGCNEENNSEAVQASLEVKGVNGVLKLAKDLNDPDFSILKNILNVIFALVLLLGWYKYIIIKKRLRSTKKRAGRVSVEILLEEANKELSILEKARKKKTLTRHEEKSLDSLKKIISDIDAIDKNKK